MSESNYTPGPWTIINNPADGQIRTEHPFDEIVVRTGGLRRAADTRLIAAAPALLAAAERNLHEKLGQVENKGDYCFHWRVNPADLGEVCTCAICELRAAIAQARGGEATP